MNPTTQTTTTATAATTATTTTATTTAASTTTSLVPPARSFDDGKTTVIHWSPQRHAQSAGYGDLGTRLAQLDSESERLIARKSEGKHETRISIDSDPQPPSFRAAYRGKAGTIQKTAGTSGVRQVFDSFGSTPEFFRNWAADRLATLRSGHVPRPEHDVVSDPVLQAIVARANALEEEPQRGNQVALGIVRAELHPETRSMEVLEILLSKGPDWVSGLKYREADCLRYGPFAHQLLLTAEVFRRLNRPAEDGAPRAGGEIGLRLAHIVAQRLQKQGFMTVGSLGSAGPIAATSSEWMMALRTHGVPVRSLYDSFCDTHVLTGGTLAPIKDDPVTRELSIVSVLGGRSSKTLNELQRIARKCMATPQDTPPGYGIRDGHELLALLAAMSRRSWLNSVFLELRTYLPGYLVNTILAEAGAADKAYVYGLLAMIPVAFVPTPRASSADDTSRAPSFALGVLGDTVQALSHAAVTGYVEEPGGRLASHLALSLLACTAAEGRSACLRLGQLPSCFNDLPLTTKDSLTVESAKSALRGARETWRSIRFEWLVDSSRSFSAMLGGALGGWFNSCALIGGTPLASALVGGAPELVVRSGVVRGFRHVAGHLEARPVPHYPEAAKKAMWGQEVDFPEDAPQPDRKDRKDGKDRKDAKTQ